MTTMGGSAMTSWVLRRLANLLLLAAMAVTVFGLIVFAEGVPVRPII